VRGVTPGRRQGVRRDRPRTAPSGGLPVTVLLGGLRVTAPLARPARDRAPRPTFPTHPEVDLPCGS
jgi:hypothetical protein